MANIPTGQEFPSYSPDNTVPIWGIMSSPPLDWRSPTTILRAMRGTFDISLPGATVFAHVYLDTTPLWIVQVTSNKRFIHTWCGGEDETYADYRSTNARYRVRVSVVVPPSRNADMAVVWYMWLSRMCEAGNEHILDYVSWQGDEAGAQEALEFFENPRIGVLADALEQRVDAEQDRVARMMEAMWTEVLDEQTRMVQEVMDRVLRLVNGGALPSVDEGPTGDQINDNDLAHGATGETSPVNEVDEHESWLDSSARAVIDRINRAFEAPPLVQQSATDQVDEEVSAAGDIEEAAPQTQ